MGVEVGGSGLGDGEALGGLEAFGWGGGIGVDLIVFDVVVAVVVVGICEA